MKGEKYNMCKMKTIILISIILVLATVNCGGVDQQSSASSGVGGSGNSTGANRDGSVQYSGRVVMDNNQNAPIVNAVVLLIPDGQFESIFTDQGRERPFDHHEFDPVTLDADSIRQYDVKYDTTDSNGFYELIVSPDRYVSCLGNVIESRSSGALPVTFRRCKGAGFNFQAGKMYFDDMSWEENAITDVSYDN